MLTGELPRQLQPGGWIELQDFNTFAYTEDNSAGPENKFIEFCEVFNAACSKIGRHGSPGKYLEGWAKDAGFVNVQTKVMKCPVGLWPKDPKLASGVSLSQDVLWD
jgi:hypothetical protein